MERRRKSPPPPVPTLSDLRKHIAWTWVHCINIKCRHRRAMALTPLIIRWCADASSDRLRRSARCTRCDARGATLQHPSRVDTTRGWAAFPADEA